MLSVTLKLHWEILKVGHGQDVEACNKTAAASRQSSFPLPVSYFRLMSTTTATPTSLLCFSFSFPVCWCMWQGNAVHAAHWLQFKAIIGFSFITNQRERWGLSRVRVSSLENKTKSVCQPWLSFWKGLLCNWEKKKKNEFPRRHFVEPLKTSIILLPLFSRVSSCGHYMQYLRQKPLIKWLGWLYHGT